MTELLYLLDCYLKEFDAKIVKVIENEKDDGNKDFLVVLDKTAFYPRGGGQPNDKGRLVINDKTINVIDVFKRDGEVFHKVSGDPLVLKELKEGMIVHGVIDWERRYYFMKCHTAAHILSAVIHKETNALITGNNIDEEKVRIDFNLESFDREAFKRYEEETNKIISEGHEVKLSILPREEAFKIPELIRLKKMLPESIQNVRVVEIEGVDVQACGGTHVKNTREIGGIQIIKLENKGKNNRRCYFKIKN